jgi:hypothetical protein
MATEYTVNAIPEGVDEFNRDLFEIKVEWRGKGRWAVVKRGHWCLSTDGEWDLESIPSERTDEWLSTHRFDLDTALTLAKEAAPHVTVNGWTVARVIAEEGR